MGQRGPQIKDLSPAAAANRAKLRALYAKDPERFRARGRAYRKAVRDWVWAYKLEHPCVDCGEADPRCLDFDHRDRASKSFTIGCGAISLVKVQTEVAKCDVRCANCHRKKSFEAQDWIALEDWERD